jgi:hypothetical protein
VILITETRDPRLGTYLRYSWIYLGTHYGLQKVQRILPKERRIFIGRLIDDLTDQYRDHFIHFIGELSRKQNDPVLWYSSRMASKSMSQTTLFHQYIYQKLLEYLRIYNQEDILLVTDDQLFITNTAALSDTAVKFLSMPGRSSVARSFRWLRGWGKRIYYVMYWMCVRILVKRKRLSFSVLLHHWMDDRVFEKLPAFHDLNLGGLGNALEKGGYSVGRLAPLRISLRHISRLRRHFFNTVIPASYLTLADLYRDMMRPFMVQGLDEVAASDRDGRILNVLVRTEIAEERDTRIYLDYLLFYSAYKQLALWCDKPGVIVYPFENQPWEKMLHLAFMSWKRVGYLHAAVPKNWLDYRKASNEPMPLPQLFLSLGPIWTDFLKREYPDVPVREVGAIRYAHLFEKRHASRMKGALILVALPFRATTAVELQRELLDVLSRGELEEYRWIIKPHPFLKEENVLAKEFARFSNCAISREDISVLLNQSSVLICSDSTVLYEAVLMGLKTISYIPEDVAYGFEWGIADYMTIVSQKEFAATLKGILASPPCGRARVEDFFSKPDYFAMVREISAQLKDNRR